MDALYRNIVNNRIPKKHFCYRYFLDGVRGVKKDYKRYVEIHNFEYDAIIKKLCTPSLLFDAQFFLFKITHRPARKTPAYFIYRKSAEISAWRKLNA
jgi:hypothetical protein